MNGMTLIVKKVSQLMCGLVFMYGIYIITHGHLTPGGGFAGGAIIAGAFILLILSFGTEMVKLRKEEKMTALTESVSIFLVVALATAGIWIGSRVFFNNFLPKGEIGQLISAGVIPLYNILIGIEVSAALLTIFLALVIYREEVVQ